MFLCLQILVLLIPLSIFRIKTYIFLLLPFFLLTICQWANFTLYRFELAEGAMISMVATNSNESSEFLTILPIYFFVFVVLSILFYVLLFVLKQPKKKLSPTQTTFIFIGVLALLAPKFLKSQQDGLDVLKLAYPSRNLISIYNTFELYQNYQNDLSDIIEAEYDVSIAENVKNTLHVLIIGESSRRENYSLYGYERNTNPKLTSIQNELYLLDNVYSAANSTIMSLRWTLSKKINDQTMTVPSLFNKANFDSLWISNQGQYGENLNATSALARTAGRTIFINNSDFGGVSFDKNLIPYLMKEIKDGNNQFIVLHLLGSHFHYKRRYPKEFNLFNGDTPPGKNELEKEKQEVINEYDNSIAYTDDLLATVISSLKTINKPTTLTYFSDHGEILYDNGLDMYGHGGGKVPTEHELKVPFILWANDQYKERHPSFIEFVKLQKTKPISSIDFIQFYSKLLELNISGIDLPEISTQKIYFYNAHGEKKLFKDIQ